MPKKGTKRFYIVWGTRSKAGWWIHKGSAIVFARSAGNTLEKVSIPSGMDWIDIRKSSGRLKKKIKVHPYGIPAKYCGR